MVDTKLQVGDTVYRHWRESSNGDRYGGGLHTITKIGDDLGEIKYDMFDKQTVIMLQSLKGEIRQSSCSEFSRV
jgi:hypothetical protein|tara:strand:- start:2233 stop:2454 length:222 start_codon:yes stop_codon:yes gene_type:complete